MPTFNDFLLQPATSAALANMEITEPTPIQAEAIPALLAGHDVVGQSATGSGKTLAYGIPMVERLSRDKREVQALVLVPTRELAIQVNAMLGKLATSRRLSMALLVGGRPYGKQLSALRYGSQIVVGTPGRVKDHLERGSLVLSLWQRISTYFWWNISAIDLPSGSLLHGKTCFHPPLLAFGIVRHVLVAHRRQFTGSVFAGVSMRVRTVGDDLSIFVGQQLWGKFFNLFRWYVQRSGEMGFSIAFRREGFDYRDLFLVKFGFQVFGGNGAFHVQSPRRSWDWMQSCRFVVAGGWDWEVSNPCGSLTVKFPKLKCRGLGSATNAVLLPKPKPRAIRQLVIVSSIGSRDVACAEWPNIRRFEHFL